MFPGYATEVSRIIFNHIVEILVLMLSSLNIDSYTFSVDELKKNMMNLTFVILTFI